MLNEAMALLQGLSGGSIENEAEKAAPAEQRSKPVVLPDYMAAPEDIERLASQVRTRCKFIEAQQVQDRARRPDQQALWY
jgi:hypothetical protein